MSLDAHRTALVALLQAVPDVGRVHGWQRYTREESKFRELYVFTPSAGPQQVRGWFVTRVAVTERALGVGRTVNEFSWQIRGYMSLNDELASEIEFDQIAEDIRAAYRADPTLGGVNTAEAVSTEEDGIQVVDAGPVLFCGALCHSALMTLKTQEYL